MEEMGFHLGFGVDESSAWKHSRRFFDFEKFENMSFLDFCVLI